MSREAREQQHELETEFATWCVSNNIKSMYEKMCWWHDKAVTEYLRGLERAAQIVREEKEKHANLLAKNVLEIAADAISRERERQ